MIHGAHTLIYAKDADKARAFFRNLLDVASVDAGHGWLIFALPPGAMGVDPTKGADPERHVRSFICDDVYKTVEELKAKGVEFTKSRGDHGWGIAAMMKVPGAGKSGFISRDIRPRSIFDSPAPFLHTLHPCPESPEPLSSNAPTLSPIPPI